jgi:hypothetical protein
MGDPPTLAAMSNPVEAAVSTVTGAPKAVAGWAKARPWVFAMFLFVTIVVAIRYRAKVVQFLTGLPVVGDFMAKLLGVAAAFLLVTLAAGDAHAAGLGGELHGSLARQLGVGLGALVVLVLFAMRLWRRDAGPAFSVFFPREDVLDLRTPDGAFSVSITPGATEQPAQFKITGDKGSFAGAWLKATGITIRNTITFDQAAAGGSIVNWDDLPRVMSGLELLHPLWGTMLTKETGSGPILKHIIEFVGSGFQYAGDDARAQIPSTDGDTVCDLYFTYPIAQRFMVRPTDQACWIGWLDQTLINFTQAVATAIAAVSTGAVIKAPTTVKVGLDYVLDNDLDIPTLAFWQRYTHNAGSETIRALGLGSNGPKATMNFERILGIYELFNVWGFGGCTTSDIITAVFLEQLGLSRVTNVDMMVKNYLKVLGGPRSPKGGIGATVPHAMAGNPFTMAASPNNALNASTLAYLALRAPGRQQEITKAPKFAGDLIVTQTYSATPNSGQHILVVQSIREFTPEMVTELQARANRAGAPRDVPLANGGNLAVATKKRGARGMRSLPRSVG